MPKLKNFFKSSRTQAFLLFLLFCAYFWNIIFWITRTLTNRTFYEYGIFFVLAVILIGSFLFKKRQYIKENWHFSFYRPAFFGLLVVFILDTINALFFHFNIFSALLFFFGLYFLLGFYVERSLWKRWVFLVATVSLTLPFAEHIQTFLGFPVRIVTAKAVSWFLEALGHIHITEKTVIFTENNATSVDLPCSGIKGIYVGSLLMFIIYFLKNVRFSVMLLWTTVGFYALLLFFNFWRVFSLIYIADILGLQKEGDAIHLLLGVIGFSLSAIFLWYVSKHLPTSQMKNKIDRIKSSDKSYYAIMTLIILFSLINSMIIFQANSKTSQKNSPSFEYNLNFPSRKIEEVPFSEKELSFFANYGVLFHKKYQGSFSGNQYSFLFVTSNSWRAHHHPEVCIQGAGHSIRDSKIIQLGDTRTREVILKEDASSIFYWFVSADGIISDYSERVWNGLLHPNKPWTLVVLRVENSEDYKKETAQLIQEINQELEKIH